MQATRPTTSSPSDAFRTLAAAVWAGSLLGLLIGGVGGRLAMRLLAVTSPPGAIGLTTDDGLVIGSFDAVNSIGLALFGVIAGVVGAVGYLGLRRFLWADGPLRAWSFGALLGSLAGAAIVRADGVDFRVVRPAWLAVALFVAMPAAFGALLSIAVERFDRPGSWFHRRPLARALAPLAVFAYPLLAIFFVGALAVTAVARAIGRRVPAAARAWESAPALAGGRVLLAAAAFAGVTDIARDVSALL